MSMTRYRRLATLAQLRRQGAQQKLKHVREQVAAAQIRLQEVEEVQKQTDAWLLRQLQQGIDGHRWQYMAAHRQQLRSQVKDALAQASKLQAVEERAREQLLHLYRKEKVMDNLARRAERREIEEAIKTQEKQLDEIAASRHPLAERR